MSLETTDTPELLLPAIDAYDPEVTILVPALNESVTVREFVNWCKTGLRKAGVEGEILIVDSSSDETATIALSAGARVLKVARRGLGRAYIDAIPYVRGRYVILGDADCTYDFREITPFVNELRAGADLVMGSRFRGSIERGAMPLHHRYLGSPGTTLLADILLGLRLTDIHCGMRAMSIWSLKSLNLQSQGWEYASEMLVSAARLGLIIREVPVNFYKDVAGRVSHVKRQGWRTPFKVGWQTTQLLMIAGADFFLIPPGLVLSVVGSLGLLALSRGEVQMFGVLFSLHSQTFFLVSAAAGYLMFAFGYSLRCLHDRTHALIAAYRERFKLNRVFTFCFLSILIGLWPISKFIFAWARNNYEIGEVLKPMGHTAISGLGLVFLGIVFFIMTLAINSVHTYKKVTNESNDFSQRNSNPSNCQ